ncbi:MFS transporter [Paraburkholderia bannensis]|uniref:MFS transporter n=1 Tax=Paraburkholderia bannensis TaxID=765414 RepID=UPI002AB7181E|nr:MFS transporter [Paraburkholderia bannensis]
MPNSAPSSACLAPAVAAPAPAVAIPTWRSFAAIGAVLLGAMISTLTSRITSLGLADIRGALGVGFDDGSWINTAFTAAQMFVGPLAVWAAFVFGVRRVLLVAASVFLVAEMLLPFATDFRVFILLQTCAGLSSGAFVPTTVSFIVRTLPARLIPFGIAAYAMNLETSLNISATLEGWYSEHLSWHWLFWQNALLCLPFMLCLLIAMRDDPTHAREAPPDYAGLLLGACGFTALVIALDQGERLFWFQSPFIVWMMGAGALLLAGSVAIQLVCARPAIHLDWFLRPNILILIVLVGLIRFCVLNTSFIPSVFLANVHGLRPLQVGDTLRWIAVPQALFAPSIAFMLLRIDPRLLIKTGFAAVAIAFALGTGITSVWAEADFIPSQLLQALGQTMVLTSVIYFLGKHVTAEHALTFGAVIQTTRLFSGQLGTTSLALTQRIFEVTNSQLLGTHVDAFNPLTLERLLALPSAGGAWLASNPSLAPAANLALLDHAVRTQAVTLALADNYRLAAACAITGIVCALLLARNPRV